MGRVSVVAGDWFERAMFEGGMDWLENVIGKAILDDAQRLVPVLSGDLHESLGVSSDDALHEIRVGSGCGEKEAEPYAARIELGFHGEDSLGRHYEQDGQPYLTPALYKER